MKLNTSSAFAPVGLAQRDPATHKIVRTLADAAFSLKIGHPMTMWNMSRL